MSFKVFLKWYANCILQCLRLIPFDAKIMLTTLLGLLVAVWTVASLHIVEDVVIVGSAIGTLFAVCVIIYRISIRGQRQPPRQQERP